jgi:hypothetical protein
MPRRFPAPWSLHELRSSWPTRPDKPSPIRTSGRTRMRRGRRKCSRTTRPGGSQRTSPSCPRCCHTKARNDQKLPGRVFPYIIAPAFLYVHRPRLPRTTRKRGRDPRGPRFASGAYLFLAHGLRRQRDRRRRRTAEQRDTQVSGNWPITKYAQSRSPSRQSEKAALKRIGSRPPRKKSRTPWWQDETRRI